MFPRHKVTSASLPACLLLFVQRSTEGRAHWRQRWCHHCDHYCSVWCPIFDQASLRAGQNVCLRTARRKSGLPVLINVAPVFISLKIVLMPPPQAHLRLRLSSSTNGSFKPTDDVFSTSLSTTIKDLFSILGTYWTNMDASQKSQTSNIKALCYSVTLHLHSCAPHSTTKNNINDNMWMYMYTHIYTILIILCISFLHPLQYCSVLQTFKKYKYTHLQF